MSDQAKPPASLPGMDFEFPYGDDIVVITLTGQVPREQVGVAEEIFLGLLKQGCRKYLADCSRAEHISTTGIGLLMYHLKTLRESHSRIVMVQPSASVSKHLEPFRFSALIPVCDTREEALQLLRQGD